jgi:hypothetical protein
MKVINVIEGRFLTNSPIPPKLVAVVPCVSMLAFFFASHTYKSLFVTHGDNEDKEVSVLE